MSFRRSATALTLFLAAIAVSAEALERRRLTPEQRLKAQRRDLEMLVLKCRVKLAERDKSIPAATAHLSRAENSSAWFASRRRLETDAQERANLSRSHVSSAALLVNCYGAVARRAERAGLAGTARQLRDARRRHLLVLREMKWVTETIEGKLWLARQFVAHGEHSEARRDYRELLARYDADGDGRAVPDGKLASVKALRSALHRSRSLRTSDYAPARSRLYEIDLCLRGRAATKRGPAIQRDYGRGLKLIDSFLSKYPGFDLSGDGKPGEDRKALAGIRVEMDLRRKLFSARCGLVNACAELARAEKQAGRGPSAASHYAEALRQVKSPLEYRPRAADLLIVRAEGLLGTGESARAFRAYRELRSGSREGGDLWWAATRGVFDSLETRGELHAARTVLVLALRGYPKDIGEKWPQARKRAAALAKRMGMSYGAFLGK